MKNPKIKHVPCYSVYPAGTEMPSREDFFAAIDSLEFSPRILDLKVFDANNKLQSIFHAALFAAVDDKLSVYLRPIDFEFAPHFIDACPRIAHVDDLYYALDCASDVIFGNDDDYLVAKFQHVNFPAPIREYLAKCKARREENNARVGKTNVRVNDMNPRNMRVGDTNSRITLARYYAAK